MKLLTPACDHSLISPHGNTAQSNKKVVRKKEIDQIDCTVGQR